MATFKATLLFNAGTKDQDGNVQRAAGFSESIYDNTSSDQASCRLKLNRLAVLRAALMPANVTINGQRIQRIDPVGATISYDNVFPGTSSAQNDLPQVALQWTVRGAGLPNSRSFILRGMPDARVVTGEYNPGSASFNAALQAYFAELQNWRFRAIDRTVLPVKIISINANGILLTSTPHGFGNGDFVNVMSSQSTGDMSPTKYSYRAQIFEVTATGGTLVLPGRNDRIYPSARGKIRKATIIYPAFEITGQEIATPTAITRKVGAPFKKFRGRRKAKRS